MSGPVSKGLIETLLSAHASRVMFVRGARTITAGEIRAAAQRAAERMARLEGVLFLHTESAALLVAGLLAGTLLKRTVAVLPHAQPAYLAEIGADMGALMSDRGGEPVLVLGEGDDARLSADTGSDLVFFTSGSTGAPKQAAKKMSQLDAEGLYWVERFGDRMDHVAGSVSHQHIYGLTFRVMLPVLAGWTSTDAQAFAWEGLAEEFGARGLAVTSPAHLSRIPPGFVLPKGAPEVVLSAGQMLPLEAAIETAAVFGAPALEILGSTETGAVATRQRRDDAEPWTPLSVVEISQDSEGVLTARSAFTDGHLVTTGDRVQMVGAGRFRLMGRADRVVKIDGKRVSLTRVEAALADLPGVAEAAAVNLDSEGAEMLGAVVVLDEAGGAELARRGAFRFTRDLRKALAERLEPAERPKRWRFVGRLPVNAQGKRVAADMAKIFDAPGLLKILDAHVTMTEPDKADITFGLKPDLAFFEGHFPGQGVLAGVAQTHIAIRLGEEVWGFLPNSHEVSRLKFRRLMMPGDAVVLTLTRDVAKGKLRFSFLTNGSVASGGVVGGG